MSMNKKLSEEGADCALESDVLGCSSTFTTLAGSETSGFIPEKKRFIKFNGISPDHLYQ